MSKLKNAPTAYTFDDFFLAPNYSEIPSRKYPDTSTQLGDIPLTIPIVASPMNTVTETDMAVTMAKLGGAAVIHRYMTIDMQIIQATAAIAQVRATAGLSDPGPLQARVFAAVGANGDSLERVDALWAAGVTSFCVDVANGHSVHCVEAVRKIRERCPEAHIMAGNVCTYDGAFRLAEAGANSIRVGIGPGSMCTTRIVTGHGVPQLSAIEDCALIKHPDPLALGAIMQMKNMNAEARERGWKEHEVPELRAVFPQVALIADGGIRSSGDIVKALAIGADAVMLGGLLAGTSDTPGETHTQDGQLYKYYHGMASEKGRSGYFDRNKTAFVPEGESTRVAYKGATDKIVQGLVASLQVGMSYAGGDNIAALRQKAQWRRVTGAGAHEGTPHGK